MVCTHLRGLENALKAKGIKETYRGQAWSNECREWVYFDCYLAPKAIREFFDLDECVVDHQHVGTHDGKEAGFYCKIHKDGIMGVHPNDIAQLHVSTFQGD